jgi:hypothetical protein
MRRETANLVGLGIALVMAVVIGVLVVWANAPNGRGVAAHGTVAGFTIGKAGKGYSQIALVRVEGRDARVEIPRGVICAKGDSIHLVRVRSAIRERYQITPRACSRA